MNVPMTKRAVQPQNPSPPKMRSWWGPARKEKSPMNAGSAMEVTRAAPSARFIVRAWNPPNAPAIRPLKSGTKKTTKPVTSIVATLTRNRLCLK